MNRCLYCYEPLGENELEFHSKCSRKIFGSPMAPIMDYTLDDIYKLGKRVVEKSVTIPGVQTKLSVEIRTEARNKKKLTIVGLWGNYIIKPQSNEYSELPENEDLTMHLAFIFGLNVVEHSLIRLKDHSLAYITKRIDRIDNQKIHMEDMCQLTERLTEDKYKGSLEQIDKIIKKFSSNPMFDSIRLFESILFSFLTGNADMHLKNYSLINNSSNISLTPFYDLLSTRLVIPENVDSEESALMMCGRKKKFTKKYFIDFGKSIAMNDKQIENVFKMFTNKFSTAHNFIDVSFLSYKQKEKYKALLIERAKRMDFF